jgi:glycosyltransferase involved in cell wall biosynthesis
MTAKYLLSGQLRFMRSKGFEVSLITSPSDDLMQIKEREGISIVPVSIQREIHPAEDTASLLRLISKLKELKPHIVNASTPKAGLLGMVAAKLAGVPLRVYVLRGLRVETKKGFSQTILQNTERITAGCAHHIVCVSESLKRLYEESRFAPKEKLNVLGKGSSNGVDVKRFFPVGPDEIRKIREKLNLVPDHPVIGFVGRLVKDKGVAELLECFDILVKSFPRLQLILVGDFEKGDPVSLELVERIRNDRRIVHCGFVNDTTPYYQAMDVLLFPSYREGFPNAPLEAGACNIPVVGFKVTGTVDAIEDGLTGRLVSFGDVSGLCDATQSYLEDQSLRIEHGRNSRERILQNFQQEMIWNAMSEMYLTWMKEASIIK